MSPSTEPSQGELASAATPNAELAAVRKQLDDVLRELKQLDSRLKTMDRRAFKLPRELLTDFQALQQLLDRFKPEVTLPEIAGWALGPRGLLALTDVISSSNAQNVVEFGSGTSTLWIAYALRRLGRGKVIAFDHLPEYAERTQALIDSHGLGWFAEVRLAPLKEWQTPRGVFNWYSIELEKLRGPIDVLVVDGPPQSTGAHARYPALPVLENFLARGAKILCDDTDRRDEQEMIEYWLEENSRLRRLASPAPDLQLLTLAD